MGKFPTLRSNSRGKERARDRVAAFVGVSGRAPPSLSQRAARQRANLLSRALTSERRHNQAMTFALSENPRAWRGGRSRRP